MISSQKKGQLTRFMQAILVLILFYGVYAMKIGIVVNSLVAILVTFLPGVLERDYNITMTPGLVLWLTSAVFLHALGTIGPYQTVWWWDHMTHAVSSSIVAGAGYATVIAVDRHVEEIYLPSKMMFVFILVFVMSFGVLWEVLEFGIGIASKMFGTGSVLTQYGLEDTLKDLLFDTIGGLIVALIGEAYLLGLSERITERLQESIL